MAGVGPSALNDKATDLRRKKTHFQKYGTYEPMRNFATIVGDHQTLRVSASPPDGVQCSAVGCNGPDAEHSGIVVLHNPEQGVVVIGNPITG